VELTAVVGEVCQHDTEVDRTGEEAGAESADGCWGDFREIDWPHDGRLADAESGNEASSIYSPEVSVVAHEDGDAKHPHQAKLSCGPKSANSVADGECTNESQYVDECGAYALALDSHDGAADAAYLHHGRDIRLDVGLLDRAVVLIVDILLEVLGFEGAGDEAFVDSAGSTKKPKRHNSKPQAPVEDAFWLTEISKSEDVDRLLHTTSHLG
jgi:hypothetical protein